MISAPEAHLQEAAFPSGRITVPGILARPAAEPAPAVLLAHEWWGLNDDMKDAALRFAQSGYAALAPDLYARQGSKVTADANEASQLMNSLSAQYALRDLNAATQYLKRQPFVEPERLAIVGFSMGGTLALTQATHNSDLRACVVFYGKVPPVESLAYLLCPVLFHHAGKDAWVTRQEVDRLQQGFTKFGKPGEIAVYPEADHAFINRRRPDVYRAPDADRAWNRTLAFLRAHV